MTNQCIICGKHSQSLHRVSPTAFICESCLMKATNKDTNSIVGVVVSAAYPHELPSNEILFQIKNIECGGIELLRDSFNNGILKLEYQCDIGDLLKTTQVFLGYIYEVKRQIPELKIGKLELFEV